MHQAQVMKYFLALTEALLRKQEKNKKKKSRTLSSMVVYCFNFQLCIFQLNCILEYEEMFADYK